MFYDIRIEVKEPLFKTVAIVKEQPTRNEIINIIWWAFQQYGWRLTMEGVQIINED